MRKGALIPVLLMSLSSCNGNTQIDDLRSFTEQRKIGAHFDDSFPIGDRIRGCLNVTVDRCIEMFKPVVSKDDFDRAISSLETENEFDINGKAMNKTRAAIFQFHNDTGKGMSDVTIFYADRKKVTQISFDIGLSLATANAKSEFDDTDVYYAFRYALGDCSQINTSIEVYRFFANNIKSHTPLEKRKIEVEPSYADDIYSAESPYIPICGHKVSYFHERGTTTQLISDSNPNGSISGVSLSFKQ